MSKKWYNLFVSVDQPSAAAEENPGEPPAESAAQAIADIAARVAEPQFAAPVGNPTSFDEIYNAAEIHPPVHGFSIMKVAEMLHSEHIRNLPREVKRSSILVALEAAGAAIQDVIEDAVKRDRALDTFENVELRALEELEARKIRENQEIQADADRILAEHRARIQANQEEVSRQKERVFSWQLKKQEEEQKIADSVSYFVAENPITTGRPPGPAAPSSNAKK